MATDTVLSAVTSATPTTETKQHNDNRNHKKGNKYKNITTTIAGMGTK